MQELHGAINKMKDPSLIRVESDELTYPMHIIIRYEIERGLMEGTVAVEDVPQLWADKMQQYLGCTPADDSQVRFAARMAAMHAACEAESRSSMPAGHVRAGIEEHLWLQGCLQDVHWSMGALGYFPTYSLGAMYAVQIFRTAEQALPTLHEDIAAGRFSGLREWLREKIHKLGSVPENGDALMTAVSGEPLNVGLFVDYLKSKYSQLYKL
jgi:carboxypeptidase Taq